MITQRLRTMPAPMALLAVALTAMPAVAQNSGAYEENKKSYIEEIIVSATRNPQRLKTLGSAVDVLTSADIASRPRFLIADLLRGIPGLAVNQSGALGTLTQVRMRGAEGNHTLVLIDGMEVGDPFNNSEFDFSTLLASDVSRVEVLRGPQSSLYGSEAIGGVISIVTAGSDAAPSFNGRAESGSFGTWSVGGRASGGVDRAKGHISANLLRTGGISQSQLGPERDGHRNLSLLGGGNLTLTEKLSASLNARYVDTRTKLDSQDFNFGSRTQGFVVDSNDVRTSKAFSARAQATLMGWDDRWANTASWAATDTRNRNLLGAAFSSGSLGRKHHGEFVSRLSLAGAEGIAHNITALVEYEHEVFENSSAFPGPQNQRRSNSSWGMATEYRVSFQDQVFLTGALRHDSHELFQNATTFRFTGAWQINDTPVKLRASVGTGVAKPSFFELYGFNPTTFIGNPALLPEDSTGWDTGLDLAFENARAVISATYFRSDLEGEIFTDFRRLPFTVRNRPGQSKRQGLELSGRWSPTPALSLAASYTYTNATEDTGRREVRRPKHIASLSVTTEVLDGRGRVGFSADYNGKQEDAEFIFATARDRVTLKSYVLGTLSASYDLTPTVALAGRVENLLNEGYEQVFTFNSSGRAVYVGLKVRLGG